MKTAEESFEEHKMVVVLYDNTDLDVLELTDLQRILIDHDKKIMELAAEIIKDRSGKYYMMSAKELFTELKKQINGNSRTYKNG